MKRIALATCMLALLQALTGCCSCCDVGSVSPCYSNCLPANSVGGGCCGDTEFSLPPSPYANQQRGARVRSRNRGLPPAYDTYSTDPYIQDVGPQMGDGSMYESFDGNVMQGDVIQGDVIQGDPMPQNQPGNSGWQPKSGNTIPSPMPVPMQDSGPMTFSTPTPIPKISTSPVSVPGPPTTGIPQTSNSGASGPNMGPMPPAIPDPVSQMGYRRQLPVQRAF